MHTIRWIFAASLAGVTGCLGVADDGVGSSSWDLRVNNATECPLISEEAVEHSCLHANFGPFRDVTASPLGASVPPETNISRPHTAFRVQLTATGNGYAGAVRYVPGETGDWVLFASDTAGISLTTLAGTPVAIEGVEAVDPALCAAIAEGTVAELAENTDYVIQITANVPVVTFVLENLSDFSSCVPTVNFDHTYDGAETHAGAVADDLFVESGVTFVCENAISWLPDTCLLFDTSNPTGGDYDLGTPHCDFGGPGVGAGGALGAPGENSEAEERVLIIAENLWDADQDGLVDSPDDAAFGGKIRAFFAEPMDIESLRLLDINTDTPVTCIDEAGLETSLVAPAHGDNSALEVELDCHEVVELVIELNSSGALAAIVPMSGHDHDH